MNQPSIKHREQQQGPHSKAIIAHGLMLLNLLFPILVYLFLVLYWLKHRRSEDQLLYVAVNQAFIAATVSTTVFILANALIVSLAQYKSTFALITFEVYFVFLVPFFLIPGLMGLVKSNASLIYYYPVLGKKFR